MRRPAQGRILGLGAVVRDADAGWSAAGSSSSSPSSSPPISFLLSDRPPSRTQGRRRRNVAGHKGGVESSMRGATGPHSRVRSDVRFRPSDAYGRRLARMHLEQLVQTIETVSKAPSVSDARTTRTRSRGRGGGERGLEGAQSTARLRSSLRVQT